MLPAACGNNLDYGGVQQEFHRLDEDINQEAIMQHAYIWDIIPMAISKYERFKNVSEDKNKYCCIILTLSPTRLNAVICESAHWICNMSAMVSYPDADHLGAQASP